MSCQQCHRSLPIQGHKAPDTGFCNGKIAMMIDGEWQMGPGAISCEESPVNYGVAPFPPPAAYPERAKTAIVRGPVLIVPAGALDKEATVHLLAWMTSPEIVAEAAYANSVLPASRTAARDPRFQHVPNLEVFVDLMAHPNVEHAATTPISAELNEALGQAEVEALHKGDDPVPLLNSIQAELAPKLREVSSYRDGP